MPANGHTPTSGGGVARIRRQLDHAEGGDAVGAHAAQLAELAAFGGGGLPGTKEAHAVNGDKRGQGSLVDSAATEKPHVGEYLIVTVGDPGVARQMVLADPDEPIGMDSATAENRPSRRTLRRFSGW